MKASSKYVNRNNTVFMAVYLDGIIRCSLWDFFNVVKIYESSLKVDNIDDAVDYVENEYDSHHGYNSKIWLLVRRPVKDNIIKDQEYPDVADYDTLTINGGLSYYETELASIDDILNLTSWETIGLNLNYIKKMNWYRKSRVLHVGLYTDSLGISLLENGKTIPGLSFDNNNYYAKNVSLDKSANGIKPDYYILVVNNFIKYVNALWSPDVISITPCRIDDSPINPAIIRRLSDNDRFSLLAQDSPYSGFYDWCGVGVSIIEQRSIIGDIPAFIRSDDNSNDGFIEMKFE